MPIIKKLVRSACKFCVYSSDHKRQMRQDTMTGINKQLISELFDKVFINFRLKENYDLHNSSEDSS